MDAPSREVRRFYLPCRTVEDYSLACSADFEGEQETDVAQLQRMPFIRINPAELLPFGQRWAALGGRLSRTPPYSSAQLGSLFNKAVSEALSSMLGGIRIVEIKKRVLLPPQPDCVEVGDIWIIGAIRPQQYDVVYRPDGVRFAFDSKTLNDTKSIGKNLQNMINDLGTEAANVHSRFPHAVVGFIVALPRPSLMPGQQARATETLGRLAERATVGDVPYKAEAVSLVVWNPVDGTVDADIPARSSPLRLERFSEHIEQAYVSRYAGLPPHDR